MTTYLPEGRRLLTAENLTALSSPEGLREAMMRGTVLEARAAMCDHEHNLIVELPCMRGVIPHDEGAVGIREGTVRDIALISRVGRAVCFTVTEITRDGEGRQVALLSRAEVQRRCIEHYLGRLTVGDVISARVTHLEPFGAFCDIGCGVVALMPIDTISVSRIEHPDERFTVGMDICAVIKSKVGSRITLSHKELLGTWQENAERFSVGETVTGVIRSLENYGAFVELSPNLAGLAELKDDLRVGNTAAVYIKSILPRRMKLKLIIIDSFSDAAPPAPPHYFITEGHINRFVYSPPECEKYIYTDFSDEQGSA